MERENILWEARVSIIMVSSFQYQFSYFDFTLARLDREEKGERKDSKTTLSRSVQSAASSGLLPLGTVPASSTFSVPASPLRMLARLLAYLCSHYREGRRLRLRLSLRFEVLAFHPRINQSIIASSRVFRKYIHKSIHTYIHEATTTTTHFTNED